MRRHSSLTSPLWLDIAVSGMREELGSPVESTDTLAVPSAMSATHARYASKNLLCAASSPTRLSSSLTRWDASLAEG